MLSMASSAIFFSNLLFNISINIGKINPAVWGSCFLTHHGGLNNLGRDSSKKQFC